MKRTILISILLVTSIAALAQPRGAGVRIGASGFDISYQHTLVKKDFIQAEVGTDFGYLASGNAGFRATVLYNFMLARPAWTNRGSWAIYSGPGLSLGYVEDKVVVSNKELRLVGQDYGFMLSIAVQAGLEYNFWFPLQLSIDLRPYIGLHFAEDARPSGDIRVSRIYDNGWFGFIPTLSVRYRF